MKALVTGGTGFIGSHLVEALFQNGVEVRCLVRKTSDLSWLKGLPVELTTGDCCDKASLTGALRDIDQVFHLAGVTKAVRKETYFEVNVKGTENLIDVLLETNRSLQGFVYLSSQAAAGPCTDGSRKKETDECEPVSPYGQSKRMAEEVVLAHSRELPVVILRPCAVYGPRDRDVYVFFKLLSRGLKICLRGQDPVISLCYVEDVVRAILLASRAQGPSGEIYFVSDGKHYRMEEVGDVFAQAMDVSPVCIRIPKWVILGVASFSEGFSKLSGHPALISRGKASEMIQENWGCDITKATTALGFVPETDLARGARLTVEWYRNANWLQPRTR